ncbi:hypothetical protein M422DRAFT_242411 [Sphaerobolus stellatus SS14]|nr:hypothetical protein M422DRAFT_242411 [Sphaerobolus stellatus SS14]
MDGTTTVSQEGHIPRSSSHHNVRGTASTAILTSFLPLLQYNPATPVWFTPGEIRSKKSQLTRQAYVHGWIEHPPEAIVEYLQSGEIEGEGIAHFFNVNLSGASFVNPKDNLQYSLGEPQGIHQHVQCRQLRDIETGEFMDCIQQKLSCHGIKTCSFNSSSRSMASSPSPTMPAQFDAQRELFTKTVGFFCALIENGCPFADSEDLDALEEGSEAEDEDFTQSSPDASSMYKVLLDNRSPRSSTSSCTGKLILRRDSYDHAFIQCEKRQTGHNAHLLLRNLKEFNIDYLEALLLSDAQTIGAHEALALQNGYGPLAPCSFFSAARDQKSFCPNWHRNDQGILTRGTLIPHGDCPTRFEIYYPYELEHCPKILIVSRNPHAHQPPPASKTPAAVNQSFHGLLERMDWRLADATPRKILIDSAFMSGLKLLLRWQESQPPTLLDLHPLLANFDHTERLINKLRDENFPYGTGFEAAVQLVKEEAALEPEERYVRCAEEYDIPGEGKFRLVVCMFKAMSELLLDTKRPSIDTAFKRLHKWQEFEIEAWFPKYSRSIVVSRAFITSQSALAHQILFRRIFAIASEDTGRPVQFRHIHGTGFEIFMADGHKGQALGLGHYCVEICQDIDAACPIEPDRLLRSLTPYEHLLRFYRYCLAHYSRNASKLRSHVSTEVYQAIMSIPSAEAVPNFEELLNIIRRGGKKAADWLKDKEKGSPFAIPALYRPRSKIPLEIWKASPSTSNGNEQAHRSINRDGTKLSMLPGIFLGKYNDHRAMQGAMHFEKHGIHSVVKRQLEEKDKTVLSTYKKVLKLQSSIQKQSEALKKRSRGDSTKEEQAIKKIRGEGTQLLHLHKALRKAKSQSSGTISTAGLENPEALITASIPPELHIVRATDTSPVQPVAQRPSAQLFHVNTIPFPSSSPPGPSSHAHAQSSSYIHPSQLQYSNQSHTYYFSNIPSSLHSYPPLPPYMQLPNTVLPSPRSQLPIQYPPSTSSPYPSHPYPYYSPHYPPNSGT